MLTFILIVSIGMSGCQCNEMIEPDWDGPHYYLSWKVLKYQQKDKANPFEPKDKIDKKTAKERGTYVTAYYKDNKVAHLSKHIDNKPVWQTSYKYVDGIIHSRVTKDEDKCKKYLYVDGKWVVPSPKTKTDK